MGWLSKLAPVVGGAIGFAVGGPAGAAKGASLGSSVGGGGSSGGGNTMLSDMPWLSDGAGVSGGTDWGKILSSGSNILGVAGDYMGQQTKSTPETSGFQGLPQDIQDWLKKTLFPDIQKAYNAPRPTMMMRQYTPEEANDPIFGSQARGYMQERKNQEVLPQLLQGLTAQKPAAATPAPAAQNALTDKNIARLKSFGLI